LDHHPGLGISVKAVRRYRCQDRCPDWAPGRRSPTALDPFAGRIAEWVAAGNRNSAELYRLLKAEGFAGGYDAVRRYLNRLIGSGGRPGRREADAKPVERKPLSARKLSFRVVNPWPDSHSARVLARLREQNPGVHVAVTTAEELMDMIRRRTTTTLAEWATKATALGDPDLANLAASLLQDAAAVQAALTEPWSNGQVEGQVNRLKTIKRQMYGRAGFELLRARVRHAA